MRQLKGSARAVIVHHIGIANASSMTTKLEAAKLADVAPEFVEQAVMDNDNITMIENGKIEMFLEHASVDTDWYDIETGYLAF